MRSVVGLAVGVLHPALHAASDGRAANELAGEPPRVAWAAPPCLFKLSPVRPGEQRAVSGSSLRTFSASQLPVASPGQLLMVATMSPARPQRDEPCRFDFPALCESAN